MGLFATSDITEIGLSGLLVLMYAVTLIRVFSGRRFSFVVKLIVLLIFSNMAAISATSANYEFTQHDQTTKDVNLWIYIQSVSSAIRDTCFNVSHWMFAFEYYSISRYMPFLLMKLSPEADMISFDEKIYKVFLVLNILLPVVNGVSLAVFNFCDKIYPPEEIGHCTFWSKFQFTVLYLVGVLMLISGVYLGYAITKIRKHLKENGGKQ
jgi:hypothetical protein